jgi:hypothetical protein
MTELRLGNGLRIEDCFGKVVRFCQPGSHPDFYRTYDCVSVEQDNSLRDSDILVANRLGARIGPISRLMFEGNRTRIEAALASVAVGIALDDSWPEEQRLWEAIRNLYRACWTSDVEEARTTKVLHKKRPDLIPIIDKRMVIGWYYRQYSESKKRGIDRMVEITKRIREDMRRNADDLRELEKEVVESGINLTRVRLFDIVLWQEYQNRGRWS